MRLEAISLTEFSLSPGQTSQFSFPMPIVRAILPFSAKKCSKSAKNLNILRILHAKGAGLIPAPLAALYC